MMSSWVHCNKCLEAPEQKLALYLTNCLHILCVTCITKGNCLFNPDHTTQNIRCSCCGNNTKADRVDTSLRDCKKVYFMNPTKLMDEFAKTLEKVLIFQESNANSLQEHMDQKSSFMKAEYLKAYKDCEHARNELKKNEMYVKKMKEIITNENSMNQRDPRRGRDISNPRSRNRSNSTDRIRAISLGLSSDKLP